MNLQRWPEPDFPWHLYVKANNLILFFQNLSENRLFYSNGSKLCILGTSKRVLPQPRGLLYNFFLNSKCCSHPHPPTHSLTLTHTAAENESSLWMLDCLICNVIPCLTVTGWQTGIGSIIQNYLLCISFTTKPNTLTLPNMLICLVGSRCFGSSGTASKVSLFFLYLYPFFKHCFCEIEVLDLPLVLYLVTYV